MGLVAPLTALLAASIPAVVGLWRGDDLGTLDMVGMLVALAAVVLISLPDRRLGTPVLPTFHGSRARERPPHRPLRAGLRGVLPVRRCRPGCRWRDLVAALPRQGGGRRQHGARRGRGAAHRSPDGPARGLRGAAHGLAGRDRGPRGQPLLRAGEPRGGPLDRGRALVPVPHRHGPPGALPAARAAGPGRGCSAWPWPWRASCSSASDRSEDDGRVPVRRHARSARGGRRGEDGAGQRAPGPLQARGALRIEEPGGIRAKGLLRDRPRRIRPCLEALCDDGPLAGAGHHDQDAAGRGQEVGRQRHARHARLDVGRGRDAQRQGLRRDHLRTVRERGEDVAVGADAQQPDVEGWQAAAARQASRHLGGVALRGPRDVATLREGRIHGDGVAVASRHVGARRLLQPTSQGLSPVGVGMVVGDEALVALPHVDARPVHPTRPRVLAQAVEERCRQRNRRSAPGGPRRAPGWPRAARPRRGPGLARRWPRHPDRRGPPVLARAARGPRRAPGRAPGGCRTTPVRRAPSSAPLVPDERRRLLQRLSEDALVAGPVERLREVERLVEGLEPARATHDRRAVPVGGRQQVVGLARDVHERPRVRPRGGELGAHDRPGHARRATELHLHGTDGDADVPPPRTQGGAPGVAAAGMQRRAHREPQARHEPAHEEDGPREAHVASRAGPRPPGSRPGA